MRQIYIFTPSIIQHIHYSQEFKQMIISYYKLYHKPISSNIYKSKLYERKTFNHKDVI